MDCLVHLSLEWTPEQVLNDCFPFRTNIWGMFSNMNEELSLNSHVTWKVYPLLTTTKQECIPVGCVPADRRPYAGVCFPGGGSSIWGGFSIRGGSSSGGGSPSSQGGFSIQPGGGWWGSSICGGVLHPAGGGSPSSPPPVNRMTDRCKIITLAKTSFRPVTRRYSSWMPTARLPTVVLHNEYV